MSIENPAKSYLWPYIEKFARIKSDTKDYFLSQCMYGREFQKDTCFKTWNLSCSELSRLCRRTSSGLLCGRANRKILELGGEPTAPAAAYPKSICRALAGEVHKFLRSRTALSRSHLQTDTFR